jgi:hypothetical protein
MVRSRQIERFGEQNPLPNPPPAGGGIVMAYVRAPSQR